MATTTKSMLVALATLNMNDEMKLANESLTGAISQLQQILEKAQRDRATSQGSESLTVRISTIRHTVLWGLANLECTLETAQRHAINADIAKSRIAGMEA